MGGVSDHPGERGGDANSAPAPVGLGIMHVFPFEKLELGGHGLDRKGKLRPEIKRPDSDAPVKLAKLGDGLLRFGGRFTLGPLDSFA